MLDTNRPIFGIGAVARMLALPPATIRTWETRYRLVVPERSPGGQRLYTRAQVDQLRFLKEQIGAGTRPGEAHRLLAEELGGGASASRGPTVRMLLRSGDGLGSILLRQLLERGGCVVTDEAADVVVVDHPEATHELQRNGHRVLALVEPGAEAPGADAVVRLPAPPEELIAAARRLAAR